MLAITFLNVIHCKSEYLIWSKLLFLVIIARVSYLSVAPFVFQCKTFSVLTLGVDEK